MMKDTIHDILVSDLLKKKVLTKKEADFYINLRIPYFDGAELWAKKALIDAKIEKALVKKTVKKLVEKKAPPGLKMSSKNYCMSDDLGPHGLFSHADGKIYDSKSRYYRSVKDQGLEIVGNDMKVEERKEIRGDFDCRKDVARAMEQTGFSMEKFKRERTLQ